MTLPKAVPAMSLPGVVLLPKTVLPLRIFEERYKEMLEDALSGDRVFAIANRKTEDVSPSDLASPGIHSVATVGLIRMSSQNPDGTSILMLEGTDRVRIDSISYDRSYPMLTVSALPTENRPNEELEAELVVNLLDKIDQLDQMLGPKSNPSAKVCHSIDDLETLCHFIMQTYCPSSSLLQRTLETTDLVQRCAVVAEFLDLQVRLLGDARDETP